MRKFDFSMDRVAMTLASAQQPQLPPSPSPPLSLPSLQQVRRAQALESRVHDEYPRLFRAYPKFAFAVHELAAARKLSSKRILLCARFEQRVKRQFEAASNQAAYWNMDQEPFNFPPAHLDSVLVGILNGEKVPAHMPIDPGDFGW